MRHVLYYSQVNSGVRYSLDYVQELSLSSGTLLPLCLYPSSFLSTLDYSVIYLNIFVVRTLCFVFIYFPPYNTNIPAAWDGGGRCATRLALYVLVFLFSSPRQERDRPPCKVAFSG